MKGFAVTMIILVCFAGIAMSADIVLNDQKQKVSYSIGLDIGKSLKKQSIDVDEAILMRGLKDGLNGAVPLLNDQEIQEVMMAFQKEMMNKMAEERKASSDKNKSEGEAFLNENKTKEGVVTLPSGLQYKILAEGKGEKPKAVDEVTVHYKGTLIDGTEFDSSYSRNQPATFKVNQVISGWSEALQLMPAGSKWHLYIPSQLAYGEAGAGESIGPNATLIFEVELISINPGDSPAQP